MSNSDGGHYAKKHGPGAVANEAVARTLRQRAVKGALPCAVAFDVAKRLAVSPQEIGRTADIRCGPIRRTRARRGPRASR